MPTTTPTPSEDNIRAIAYGLWLEEGRPDGRAEAHWLKAHELATGDLKTSPAPKKTAAVPAGKTTRRRAS